MERKSDVFFTDLRAGPGRSLLDKVEALIERAGLPAVVARGDLVAVKLHFGERGNTSFIRPVFVRSVVDAIKALGGRPFLTDANTLYVGSRSDAVSHLETAIRNGFDYAVVGAPLIIADGLRGGTAERIPVAGKHFSQVAIAAEIVRADALVSLAHFKGHELTGFGGTLKNLGMGSAAREGKLAQHSTVSPAVSQQLCAACGECVRWCSQGAIAVGEVALIDSERCIGCGECILTCPREAIEVQWNEAPAVLQEKVVEHAVAVLEGKRDKSLFLNAATQISPACDCYGHTDAPIVGDVGFFASRDPVALDQATVDAVNALPGNPASALRGGYRPGEDKFRGVYPEVDWTVQLAYAQTLGLGTRSYRLVDASATESADEGSSCPRERP